MSSRMNVFFGHFSGSQHTAVACVCPGFSLSLLHIAASTNMWNGLAVEGGTSRIITAGGETSGAIVEGLRLDSFEIGPEIDPGVPALRARKENM